MLHWRHIVLLAATYSICLKPQCGHSTLTFAGNGFAGTTSVSSNYAYPKILARAAEGRCLYRLIMTHDWNDEIIKGTCLTRDGEIVHPALKG